jgi:hypothetical protein
MLTFAHFSACFWCEAAFNKQSNRSRHHKIYHAQAFAQYRMQKELEDKTCLYRNKAKEAGNKLC